MRLGFPPGVTLKQSLLLLLCLVACSFAAQAFPSEKEVASKLKVGLTADEVVALFGEPPAGRVVPCVNCTLTYLPPMGSLTAEKEGYAGLAIHFSDGQVKDWKSTPRILPTPSPKAPPQVRSGLKFFALFILFGIVTRLLFRTTPVAAMVATDVAQAFENRTIKLEKLLPEFRFITHETTLAELIDKVGRPSRTGKIPINAEQGLGSALVSSNTGKPEIVTYEYDLPYHAAVIVIPEFPCEAQNRIRAVFYRPIQPDLADLAE